MPHYFTNYYSRSEMRCKESTIETSLSEPETDRQSSKPPRQTRDTKKSTTTGCEEEHGEVADDDEVW